jgi:hypothetical protein
MIDEIGAHGASYDALFARAECFTCGMESPTTKVTYDK